MEEKFNLEFTLQEVEILAAGLNELPMKVSRSVLDKLVQQVNELRAKAASGE